MIDVIETAATTVWLEGGILHIRTKGIPSTAQTLTETFDAVSALTGDMPHPVIADARSGLSWEPATWGTFLTRAPDAFTAIALVIDPAGAPRTGGFPEVIERLFMPFRLFTDEGEALTFLASRSSDA